MTAYLYNSGSGFPGAVTRIGNSTVESVMLAETVAFGKPIKIVGGLGYNIDANDTAADFYGVMARSVPTIADPSDVNLASTDGVQNVLRRGYGAVACATGTPARGGQVYMRVVAESSQLVGDFETASDNSITAGSMVGTGNATAGTLSVAANTVAGVYRALFTAATKYNLVTPAGDILQVGTTGVAYTAAGLTFTITAGATPAVAGDYIDFTVVNNTVALSGVYWAIDGKDASNVTEIEIR